MYLAMPGISEKLHWANRYVLQRGHLPSDEEQRSGKKRTMFCRFLHAVLSPNCANCGFFGIGHLVSRIRHVVALLLGAAQKPVSPFAPRNSAAFAERKATWSWRYRNKPIEPRITPITRRGICKWPSLSCNPRPPCNPRFSLPYFLRYPLTPALSRRERGNRPLTTRSRQRDLLQLVVQVGIEDHAGRLVDEGVGA